MGPGSDVFGRKPFLLLSLFGSCFGNCCYSQSSLGSIFQAMSYSMWALIVWRSFTGLFAGSLILVQAYCFFLLFTLVLLLILSPQKIAVSICPDSMLVSLLLLFSVLLLEEFLVK